MKAITERDKIIEFMSITGLNSKYSTPNKILYSDVDGVYVIGLIVGYKTYKEIWQDPIAKGKSEFSWNPEHSIHNKKTLLEAGF